MLIDRVEFVGVKQKSVRHALAEVLATAKYIFFLSSYLWHIYDHQAWSAINSSIQDERREEKKNIIEQCFFYMCACYKHKNDNGNCFEGTRKMPVIQHI